MAEKQTIQLLAKVEEALPDAYFKLRLIKSDKKLGKEVIGHASGKMRKNYIRITPGDQVFIELSPYDLTRGRITYRLSQEDKKGMTPKKEEK